MVASIPPGAPDDQARLTGIRVGRHDAAGFDRIVFDLTGLPGYQVHRLRDVLPDGSGATLDIRCRSFLTVRLEPAVAHDDDGQTTSPCRIRRPYKTQREVRRAGDSEGVVTYAFGLRRPRDYRVSTETSPARLVVGVAHCSRHPFNCEADAVQVVFANATPTRQRPR